MARKSNSQFQHRKLDEEEMQAAINDSLSNLSITAKVYDEGHAPIAYVMATLISWLMTANGAPAKIRAGKKFHSPTEEFPRGALSVYQPLILTAMGGPTPSASHIPSFYLPPRSLKSLSFSEWWEKDVIYRAGAAPRGTMPPGSVPVNSAPLVPFDEREKLVRREFIKLIRDKRGAHPDQEWPSILDDVQEPGFGMMIETPEGLLSTVDGTLPIIAAPLGAMVRQIAHEVLIAYGINDPSPLGY